MQVSLQPVHAVLGLQTRLQPLPSPLWGVYFHLIWCHLTRWFLPQTISVMGLNHNISPGQPKLARE